MTTLTRPNTLVHDIYVAELIRSMDFMLEKLRFFLNTGGASLLDHPVEHARWLNELGYSKASVKWLAPIYTNYGAHNSAVSVFGSDPSPVAELGTRSVSSYIRHLLYGLGWSQDAVAQHLVEQHSVSYNSARPLLRRIVSGDDDGKKN